ncbi:MAG: efflux transporter outer membrane subunit [Pseudomonadota bacterium]|nr:efflux transporter outer membrane subunit [Pseudomonadota bacterium]
MLLSVCACTTVAPPPAPLLSMDVPPHWSAADAAGAGAAGVSPSSLASWWQRFDDPLLGDLVGSALQANTSVVGAQAALRQSQAFRDLATAALWPTLGSSASAQRSTAGHSTGNSFRLGLDAAWTPDVFGAGRAAVDAGEATVRASAASLGDLQVQIAAEVALSYVLLRTAQARFAIAVDNLASQQETLQITQWREQAGLVTSLESEQARAAAEQTRALLPALQTSIEQTRHALAVLTGQVPTALAVTLAETRPVPQADPALALSIPAQTLRQRADVRAAEYQVAAALASVREADARRWPSFAIGGSVGLSALTAGALTNGGSVVSSLLASVSWPVFDSGAARAQVRVQQAALDQAQQVYRAAVLGALKEVEDALIALSGDRQRLLSLRNAADAAGNAALLARQRYSSGLVDFQTVLETQRTQFGAQDSVASTSADVSGDLVRLFKALGGGWRSDLDPGAADAARPAADLATTATPSGPP